MMRSNTKASRTAAEREEYYRINALLDQALDLTFPCSDPVAITINGIRRKGATDSGGKREPVTRSQEFSRANLTRPTCFLRTLSQVIEAGGISAIPDRWKEAMCVFDGL